MEVLIYSCIRAYGREVMYGKIIALYPNFGNLSSEEKFLYMMTADDEILYAVAHFGNKHLPWVHEYMSVLIFFRAGGRVGEWASEQASE